MVRVGGGTVVTAGAVVVAARDVDVGFAGEDREVFGGEATLEEGAGDSLGVSGSGLADGAGTGAGDGEVLGRKGQVDRRVVKSKAHCVVWVGWVK